MVPFFLKIRKRLADKNQFFRYSRYAIGEIVLVVIGILIALQINTWNEAKKDSQLKETYIEALKVDIKRDIENLQNWIKANDEAETEGLYLLKYLEGQSLLIDSSRIVRSFLRSHYKPVISLSFSTYNDLINSGNIRVFKDLELKKLLDEYYAQDNWRMKLDDRITQTLWYNYRDKITEYIDPTIFKIMYESNFSADKLNDDLIKYNVEWELIKNNKELQKELKKVLAYRVVIRNFFLKPQIERSFKLLEIMNDKNKSNNSQ